MLVFVKSPPISIDIGNQGENLYRQITFNWAEWKTLYPNGTVAIYFQRPDMEECYEVVPDTRQQPVIWSPDLTATCVYGEGNIIIRLLNDEVIAKSVIIETNTSYSPDFTLDAPEVFTPWLEKISRFVNATEEAEIAAEEAKQIKDDLLNSFESLTNLDIEAIINT